MVNAKAIAIIQARMSSFRLPGKVMLEIEGKSILERVIERVQASEKVEKIIVATSTNYEDDLIEQLCERINIKVFRGDLQNVLSRFKQVAIREKATYIVRVTADNPLTDTNLIDYGLEYIEGHKIDYLAYKNIPIGSGVEIFTSESLILLSESEKLNAHNLEHVTSFYYQNPEMFQIKFIEDFYSNNLMNYSITVDTFQDYIKVSQIYRYLIQRKIKPSLYIEEIIRMENDK